MILGEIREILREEMGCFFQAATGVEQHLLARDFDAHAEIVIRFQVIHDHVGEVIDVDDRLANSETAQAREGDLQQSAAIDFDQSLGTVVGERTQARTQASG